MGASKVLSLASTGECRGLDWSATSVTSGLAGARGVTGKDEGNGWADLRERGGGESSYFLRRWRADDRRSARAALRNAPGLGAAARRDAAGDATTAPDERLTARIEAFCGDCHGLPQAETYPRDAWHDKVRRAYEYYARSGRNDLDPPPIYQTAKYFRARAPNKSCCLNPRRPRRHWP